MLKPERQQAWQTNRPKNELFCHACLVACRRPLIRCVWQALACWRTTLTTRKVQVGLGRQRVRSRAQNSDLIDQQPGRDLRGASNIHPEPCSENGVFVLPDPQPESLPAARSLRLSPAVSRPWHASPVDVRLLGPHQLPDRGQTAQSTTRHNAPARRHTSLRSG